MRRYIDLAYAKEDQIMCATKLGTGVGFGVADYFTFGLTTAIGKSVEKAAIAGVRGVRRAQAAKLFTEVNAMPPAKLERLHRLAMLTNKEGEPDFDWLRSNISYDYSGAAALAGTVLPSSENPNGVPSAQEFFVDYVGDAVLEQAASLVPFGIGAAKAGFDVAKVTHRIEELRKQIKELRLRAI